MNAWSVYLTTLSELAGQRSGEAIIAGDLNATLRYGSMGVLIRHGDVLMGVPVLQRGTWPHSAPRALPSGIDHILVPLNGYAVEAARVVEIPGSDHAAVAATLTPLR